jgi:hypothetical protein
MKSLIFATVLLMGITSSSYGGERKHKDCECKEVCVEDCKACDQCKDCIKRRRVQERKKIAAEEARRRRERLHRRKLQPRIIIIVQHQHIDRHHHHHNCRCNRCSWGVRYRPFRRTVGVYINTIPRRRPTYNYSPRRRVDSRPKVWYDGLRTRTDRPSFRR